MSSFSVSSSVNSAIAFSKGLLQKQASLRSAQQLEAEAASLTDQAANARKDADLAERKADSLEINAKAVHSAANNARQSVTAGLGALKVSQKVVEEADKIYQSFQSGDATKNLYGPTGQTTNSSYQSGTIVKVAS